MVKKETPSKQKCCKKKSVFLTFHSEFVSKLNFYTLLLIDTVVMWFLYMSYDSLFDAVKGRFRFEPIGYLTIF